MIKSSSVKAILFTLLIAVGAQAKGDITLVLGRPGETKDLAQRKGGWYSVVLDSYLHYRLMGFRSVDVVPSDSLSQFFGARGRHGLTQSRGQLNRAAHEFGGSHVVQVEYALNPREKTVILKLKVYPKEQPTPIYEFSSRFPVISTPRYIDSALADMAVALGSPLNTAEKTDLRANILMKDYGLLENMGTAALKISETKRHEQVAGEFKELETLSKGNPNFWLGHYINAEMNAQHGLYKDAGKSYSAVVKNKQFRWAPMYVRTVRAYRLGNSLREATATLKDAEKEGLTGVRLTFEDASVKAALGEADAAATGFKKVLAVEPANPEALLYLAKYYNETKAYGSVFAYTKKLISSKQLIDKAYVENGRAYLGQKKTDAALKAFKQADEQIGECYEANYYMGEVFVGRKEYDSAARQYQLALKGINDDEELLLKASAAYQDADDIKGARVILENYSSLFPKSLLIERELGLVYFEVKDTVKARAALERCREMEPPSKEVFLTLSQIYRGAKEWEKVINISNRALPLVDLETKSGVHFGIGVSYLNLAKFDDAEKSFRAVVALDPDYAEANSLIGELLFKKGVYKEALTFFNSERTYHGNSVAMQERIVEANYKLAFYKTTRKEALALLELNRQSTFANRYLARVAMQEKKYDEALSFLKAAEGTGKVPVEIYLELARGFGEGAQWESAIYSYEIYLKSEAKDDDSWLELGLVYYNGGEDEKAIKAYLLAYDLNPKKNTNAIASAGHIIYENEEHDRAEVMYTQFLATGNKADSVHVNQATLKVRKESFKEALDQLDQLSAESKKESHVIRLYALSYIGTKQKDAAIPAIEKTLENYPKDLEMHELAAIFYEENGNLERSSEEYEKVIALGGKKYHKRFGFHLAQIYEKLAEDDKAIAWYVRNVSEFPAAYENHVALSGHYITNKEYKKTVSLLAGVVTKKGAPVILNKPLAIAYKELGEDSKASKAYEALLAVEGNDSTAWFELGSIYYVQKEYEEAIPALKKAVAQMPQHKWAHYRLASSLFRIDEPKQAQQVLAGVWQYHNSDADVLALYTKVLSVTKDTLAIIKVYEQRAALEKKNFDLNVELGDIYVAQKQIDLAATALARALSIEPTSFDVRMRLINYYIAKKDEVTVEKLVVAGIKYHPKSAPLYMVRGMSSLRLNKDDDALSAFEKAAKLDDTEHEAYYNIGLIYQKQENLKKARAGFAKAVAASPDKGEYRLALARIQMLQRDYTQAVYQGAKILPLMPENGPVYAEVGTFFEAHGDTAKAEELYNESLIYNDKCSVCYQNLGAINYKRLKYEVAEINLTKAVALDDTANAKAAMYLGDIKRSNGDTTEAVALFTKALEASPENDEVLFKFINATIEAGDIKLAESVYKKNGDRARSNWFLMTQGRVAEAQGDFPAAKNYYQHAIKVDEESSPAYIGLGRLDLEDKDNESAIQNFGMAMGYDPANIETYILTAQTYFRNKEYEVAYEYLREGLKINPKYPDIYYYMAMVHSRKKQHDKAVQILQQALKYNETRARIHYALGTELRLTVQPRAAIEEFEAALKYDKKNIYEVKAYKQMGDIYYEHLLDNKNAKKYYKKYIRAGGTSPAVKEKLSTL